MKNYYLVAPHLKYKLCIPTIQVFNKLSKVFNHPSHACHSP